MDTPDAGHMYERIAAALRDQITNGTLRPGDRLPTQQELVDTFGCSRQVVRFALDLLENEGLVDRIQGFGTTVRKYDPLVRRSALHYRDMPNAPFAEEALAAQRTPRYTHHTRLDRIGPDVASRLGLEVGTEVMRTDYVSYVDDQPAMLVTSYENLEYTRGTVIEKPEEGYLAGAGLVPRFTAIGRRPTKITERVRVRPPRPAEEEMLRIKPGVPVILISRTTQTRETILETADIIIASNLFELENSFVIEPLVSTLEQQHERPASQDGPLSV
ncbi:GntR family transcriptional regulator [Rhizocola hellebori]|nr:GntR family transcriptional regulator [Rhizocola hellebori]